MESEGSSSCPSKNDKDLENQTENTEENKQQTSNEIKDLLSMQVENIDSDNVDGETPQTEANNNTDSNVINSTENSTNNKRSSNRFARRNYRLRTDSSSSSSSQDSVVQSQRTNGVADSRDVDMEVADNANVSDAHLTSSSSSQSSSVFSHPFSSPSDHDDSVNNVDSARSDISDDTETEINRILNKPKFSSNFYFTKNLFNRQGGLVLDGNKQLNDRFSTAFINRMNGSHFAVQRLRLTTKLEHHEGCVNSLNFNKSGTLLVSGSDDLHIVVWNWAKNSPVHVIRTNHVSNVFQTKFADDLSTGTNALNIITSARDGYVRQIIVPPGGGEPVDRLLVKHRRAVHKITLPDTAQDEVLTAGEDACVIRIDLRDKQTDELLCLRVNESKVPLYSIAAHPFEPEFCVAGRDRYVRVYDRRNVKEPAKSYCPHTILKKEKQHDINITCAVYNYLGTEVLASYSDENMYLFDNKNQILGTYLHSYSGHKNSSTIKGVNFFGPCSEFVMSGSDCGNLFIWDKEDKWIVQWLRGDEDGAVNCLEGHPRFPILATSGLDHNVKIYSPTNENAEIASDELRKCVKKNLTIRNRQSYVPCLLNRSLLRYFATHFPHDNNTSSENSDDDYRELELGDDNDSDSEPGAASYQSRYGEPCTTS